ncbi:hypothetical protein GII30_10075 [Gordonia amarae]|uniref:Uncharacterized protein n=1 Tax=Gordonia amarae TaxID=36821 RepID=A0A857KJ95_9ACTN|nr:hypothetical protein [Gordonia amarae]MCS3878730.1 chromosome segregation ATPase [Gordonia amarae]QHN17313.1 hypothetical protein GII35_10300 [Gordonia amarae]QHN21839.1 hypothetical protein GII34_10080 [Gordonia amarae]QHN30689.1 hypothetical protein GII32_10090 [Gordonia amarae]QHN39465.1 hypothetical protein GII30_10075 [Gordonia amarae]
MEREVEGLKTENKELRRDVSAARVLAAGADQDVSNMHAAFRAQTMVLNAMRETQLEHGKRIGGLDQRMGGLDQRMDGLDQRMGGLDQRMDGLDQRMDGLDQRMDGLDQRMDGLDQRMDGLDQRMDGLDQRMAGLESEMRTGFATMAAGMQQITTLLTTALDDGSFGLGRNRPGNT